MGVQLRKGDLARELGISPSTVTFYTGIGLLKPEGKTPSGLYLFDLEKNRQRFEFITKLKKKRFKLKEIKEHLDLGKTNFSL